MTTGGTKWLGNVIENRIKARRATKAKAADSKPGAVAREAETAAKTEIVVESANSGQEFLPKGYKPQPGERTFEGYVNSSVSKDKRKQSCLHVLVILILIRQMICILSDLEQNLTSMELKVIMYINQ